MKKDSVGVELVKQLPIKEVYNDLAHPVLSTLGKTLQGATRVALAPVTALIWGYDKISSYLDVAIPEYFARKKVKQENIITPDLTIAVPVIEAMRYTSHKPELRDMFTNLLGYSMNSEAVDEHPAFVDIIKQLCSDECKILNYLYSDDEQPMIKLAQKANDNGGFRVLTTNFSDICFNAGCEKTFKFPEYLDNLHRLGLVDVFYDKYLFDDTYYDNLRKNINFINLKPKGVSDSEIIEQKGLYTLSEFGKKFCGVCID